MRKLNRVKADYLKSIKEKQDSGINIRQIDTHIKRLKLEMTELDAQLSEMERTTDNAVKGIGQVLSIDESISLKKNVDSTKNKLAELKSALFRYESSLINQKNTNLSLAKSARAIINELTDLLADQAAADLAIPANDKLKEFCYLVLAQQGLTFSGKAHDFDVVYQKIGEKFFKKHFQDKLGNVILPTIEKAMEERDLMIENIA